jgi:hypothetical protein
MKLIYKESPGRQTPPFTKNESLGAVSELFAFNIKTT